MVLCSGKVYYDLYEAREAAGIDDVYLMRVEQLYPFPARALITELSRFPQAEMVWAQEEPKNMGAWSFIEPNIEWVLQHTAAAQHAAALRRPPGVGGHGDGPRQQAQPGAEGAGRAGALRLRAVAKMAIEIMVPALGESVTEATVGQWFKKPGDAVTADEPLVELETDKVTVEVPAPAAGVLADIKVAQGTTVAIGSVLGSISEGAGRRGRSRAARRARPHPSR